MRDKNSTRFPRIYAASICLAYTLGSGAAHADTNHGQIADDGRFTPNQAGATFPPQPRSVENVRQFAPIPDAADRVVTNRKGSGQASGAQVSTQSVTKNLAAERTDATALALASSDIQNLLGLRYAHISTVTEKDKWGGDSNRYAVTFFSHSNNQTVQVSVEDGELDDINATPAGQNQPPLAETEMVAAIDLAKTYWAGQGNGRIGLLTGYAIQTFQADGRPHATRVAYVSFHVESPELPELLTWVDLNSRQVIRAEVAQ
jgi:hypothetical protein